MAHDAKPIPSGVRNAHWTAEPADASRIDAKPRRLRVLIAALEKELHPDAEAEQRDAELLGTAHRRVETEAPQLARAVSEVPDAREHHRARG